MDELTLMRDFGAERVKPSPAARAEALAALEARIVAEAGLSAAVDARPEAGLSAAVDAEPEAGQGAAVDAEPSGAADGPPIVDPRQGVRPRRRFFGPRRRVLVFAGATALAAVLAAVLVLSSGPTAQPAAAAVLRQTAAIAAASNAPGLMPGPNQLLYVKAEQEELQQWNSGIVMTYGGLSSMSKGRFGGPTFGGLVRWREEAWMSNSRTGRHRMVLGGIKFLSPAERRRWKRAGSPLPGGFDGGEKSYPGEHVLESRRGVRDVEGLDGPGYGKFAGLPTEAKALRRAIEGRQPAGKVDRAEVIAELWEILDKVNSSPAHRAAVFNALAEMPGIELNRDATDMVGRHGYALGYENQGSAAYGAETLPGIRVEYIFDPQTSAVLGRREVLADPAEVSPQLKALPAGTVRRQVAYLGTAVVDTTHQRPKAARAG